MERVLEIAVTNAERFSLLACFGELGLLVGENLDGVEFLLRFLERIFVGYFLLAFGPVGKRIPGSELGNQAVRGLGNHAVRSLHTVHVLDLECHGFVFFRFFFAAFTEIIAQCIRVGLPFLPHRGHRRKTVQDYGGGIGLARSAERVCVIEYVVGERRERLVRVHRRFERTVRKMRLVARRQHHHDSIDPGLYENRWRLVGGRQMELVQEL